MNDLDTLRPEVQQALAWLKSGVRPGTRSFDGWSVIRAELLRLAKIEEERWAVVATRNGALERAEKAEAELAALKARIAHSPRADGQRVFDLLGLPIEYGGTLALVPVEE